MLRRRRCVRGRDGGGGRIAAARRALAQRTLAALDNDDDFLPTVDADLRADIRRDLQNQAAGAADTDRADLHQMRVHLAVLERKRHELVRLAADHRVEDSVMWEIQHQLDREESRLEGRLATADTLLDDDSQVGADQRQT